MVVKIGQDYGKIREGFVFDLPDAYPGPNTPDYDEVVARSIVHFKLSGDPGAAKFLLNTGFREIASDGVIS